MFAAGLGAGLLFYGIAEPVSHWSAPPHGLAEPQTREAALVALRYTYFHWGFNGWAMYAVMGGAMAYFGFRKSLPMLVSATLTSAARPEASDRPLGRLVDALAIVATLFGTPPRSGSTASSSTAGSIPLRRTQVQRHRRRHHHRRHRPLPRLGHLRRREGHQLPRQPRHVRHDRAVPVLPRRRRLDGAGHLAGIESIGTYVIQVLPMSLQTGVGDEQWMAGWTIFYWAWWVSWAPFVGMFVARISRGRTIREFVIGVVAAPTGFGFFWFAVVGGTGIELATQRQGRHRRSPWPLPSCRCSPRSTRCRCPSSAPCSASS